MTSQGWNTTLLNHWHRRQGKNHYDSNIWDVIYSAYHFQVVLVKSWEIFFSSATFTISPTVTKDLELTKNFEILLIGQPTTFRIGHKKQDKRQVWPHYKPLKNRFHCVCVCVFIVKMSVLVQCFFSFLSSFLWPLENLHVVKNCGTTAPRPNVLHTYSNTW